MELAQSLKQMTALRPLLKTPVLSAYCSEGQTAALAEAFAAGFDSLAQWLDDALRYTVTPYSLAVCRGEDRPNLTAAAELDLALLSALFAHPLSLAELTAFYQSHGCGEIARYPALHWNGAALSGIMQVDSASAQELMGYQWQREEVTRNTRALVEGRPCQNVLLYGDSGTGKSATVKHQLSIPDFARLRLVEVDKRHIASLPELMNRLRREPFPFILFIDDLAFDEDDMTYSVMKSILEGGLERRPQNIAIYATSNRRHLVRQSFADRAGDELDRMETIAEKTSLAERFGLRIAFMTLTKAEYLALVEHLADFHGIVMERDLLRAEAVKFEAMHPGKTPRTAQQFVDSLMI